MSRPILFGSSLSDLTAIASEAGQKPFAAKQLAQWLYAKRVSSIEQMSNLSKEFRSWLIENTDLGFVAPTKKSTSVDGTKKYLFKYAPALFIETAMIPDKDRITVCVSSQAGCKLGCRFCATGKQGFQSHLSAGQIINQLVSIEEAGLISNIVFMGMGEPFDNTDQVLKSIDILTASWGFAMSPTRITVSSVGLIPGIQEFLSITRCNLAISLHSPFDEERKMLMPVENSYKIHDVLKRLKDFEFSQHRRLSFEYIVFKNLNHSERHVRELAKLLGGFNCRVNLIRYHSMSGSDFQSPDDNTMQLFCDQLNQVGLRTTIRQSKGLDIDAACGLLSTKELLEKQ